MIGLRPRSRKHLIAANRVRREFHQVSDAGADFLVVLVPIHHHGFPPCKFEIVPIILSGWQSMISSPFAPALPVAMGLLWSGALLSSCASGAGEPNPRSGIHEEFVQRQAHSLRRQVDRLWRRRGTDAGYADYSVYRRRRNRARHLEGVTAGVRRGGGAGVRREAAGCVVRSL